MSWVPPPPGPDRPECPYIPGFVMKAREHVPPVPFGQFGRYPPGKRDDPPDDLIATLPQTRHVLEYPPEDTQWPRGKPRRTATITVTERIIHGHDQRSKLVVCQVLVGGDNRPFTAVAKIYDALYYVPLEHGEEYVVQDAEWDYSGEATAYATLQATKIPQKPGFTPAYYGSWTFDLSLAMQGKAYKRSVRLILIEHIQGATLRDLSTPKHPDSEPSAHHYDEAYRLEVLAQLLEGVVMQKHAGVDQHDLASRNVMICPDPRKAEKPLSAPRVVLIDYNIAIVTKYSRYGPIPFFEDKPLPPNPVQLFWTAGLYDFYGWCPDEWHREGGLKKPFQDWLIKTFIWNNAAKFEPLHEDHPLRKTLDSLP
ncbi:hypothetical protein F5X98DRAFT_339090 [Xylaria grammica]|nr:hypothetical protein F5X98DRAFT_339090 [Xylaria grammica]